MSSAGPRLEASPTDAKNRHRESPPPPPVAWGVFELLGEGSDPVAAVLWSRLRAVRLWAATPKTVRHELFSPAWSESHARRDLGSLADTEPELAAPLAALASIILDAPGARSADVSDACLRISNWATAAALDRTALQYAEAAAYINRRSAAAAAAAGQACARLAEYDRAQMWYERAISVARLLRDNEWYSRGHLRLGGLFFQRGDHERARTHFSKAFWRGRMGGLRGLAAMAAHDLFTLEAEVGTFDAAMDSLERALDLYPVQHPRIPFFASDCAYTLTRFGFYGMALPVLRDAARLIPVADRAIVTGVAAHAAGGAGNREQFDACAAEVLELISRTERGAAAALVETAYGARLMGDWHIARSLAEHALTIATSRGEGFKAADARALLDQIKTRVQGRPPAAAPPQGRTARLALQLAGLVQRHAASRALTDPAA